MLINFNHHFHHLFWLGEGLYIPGVHIQICHKLIQEYYDQLCCILTYIWFKQAWHRTSLYLLCLFFKISLYRTSLKTNQTLHTALQITLVKMMRSSSTISINFKLSTILNTVTSIIQDHIIDQSIYWKTIKQLTILNTVNPCLLCYINNVQGH